MSESQLVASILEMLACQPSRDLIAWRNNSGMMKRGSRYIRFGAVGSPDIICIVRGRFLGIECKTDDGKQDEKQESWQRACERAGGMYVVCRSVQEAVAALQLARDGQRRGAA